MADFVSDECRLDGRKGWGHSTLFFMTRTATGDICL